MNANFTHDWSKWIWGQCIRRHSVGDLFEERKKPESFIIEKESTKFNKSIFRSHICSLLTNTSIQHTDQNISSFYRQTITWSFDECHALYERKKANIYPIINALKSSRHAGLNDRIEWNIKKRK